jgi:hypothetical protein
MLRAAVFAIVVVYGIIYTLADFDVDQCKYTDPKTGKKYDLSPLIARYMALLRGL